MALESVQDINEVFDDIFMLEEKTIEESYKEGFRIGCTQGNSEGYHLGYHRGAELGAEVGYYEGVVKTYLNHFENQEEPPEKILKTLKNLRALLETFPKKNAEDVDILQQANVIRANFKKLCAQLKVDLYFPETSKLSF